MRLHLLLLLSLTLSLGTSFAQTKSTGVVNLLSGMTAKLDLDSANNTATLVFTGPSDRWFALQFGDFNVGGGMGNGQDIVYYNGSTLVDAVHNGIGIPPTDDTNNWTIMSNTTSSGIRTIIASRAFNTGDSNDYTFNYSNGSIDFAFSRSNSQSFSLAYHGASNRGYAINNAFSTLGIADHEAFVKDVKLIPNPASTSFTIQANFEQDIAKTTIYNSLGQNVLSIKNNTLKIDISALPTGNYYVEIENDLGAVSMEKLIIR